MAEIQDQKHIYEISVSDIIVGDEWSAPRQNKIERYRAYFRKKGVLAHRVVINENNKLRDGYATYLIAKENGIESLEAVRVKDSDMFHKLVVGYHVRRTEDGYYKGDEKRLYMWLAKHGKPIVPGDILLAETGDRRCLVRVAYTDYVIGEDNISKHKRIVRHIKAPRFKTKRKSKAAHMPAAIPDA